VQALVYNQTIITPEPSTPSGITFPWDTTIIPLVISELEELIRSHTLSEVLASISQKEVDSAFNNDQTIVQMRLEMTGQQMPAGMRKDPSVPQFKSRTMITAQFFEKKFQEKAAKVGVSVEWIDIGTWQLPSNLILDKHKEAWNLSRENAKRRNAVERSRKKRETTEIFNLVDAIVIKNYEKSTTPPPKISNREFEKLLDTDIEAVASFRRQALQQGSQQKRDSKTIALEMLNAFRKELRAGKLLIENENKLQDEKQADLARIDKALTNISHLTPPHWVQKP